MQSSVFSTPRFASLQWRVDVASHSRRVGELSQPTAIVQINTKSTLPSASPAATPVSREKQLQFELDRSTVANVLLEMEKIDAIMTAAQ